MDDLKVKDNEYKTFYYFNDKNKKKIYMEFVDGILNELNDDINSDKIITINKNVMVLLDPKMIIIKNDSYCLIETNKLEGSIDFNQNIKVSWFDYKILKYYDKYFKYSNQNCIRILPILSKVNFFVEKRNIPRHIKPILNINDDIKHLLKNIKMGSNDTFSKYNLPDLNNINIDLNPNQQICLYYNIYNFIQYTNKLKTNGYLNNNNNINNGNTSLALYHGNNNININNRGNNGIPRQRIYPHNIQLTLKEKVDEIRRRKYRGNHPRSLLQHHSHINSIAIPTQPTKQALQGIYI